MSQFTLMALRAMATNPDISGNAMRIQGISDMVEEYLGVNRDIFRREFVKTHAIRDGALLMWQKKQYIVAQQYNENDSDENYEKLTEVDMYYIDLYDLYHDKYSIGTFEQHVNKLTFVQDDNVILQTMVDIDTENEDEYWQDEYDYYMNDTSDANIKDLYNHDRFL
jgi:hypothetical protein